MGGRTNAKWNFCRQFGLIFSNIFCSSGEIYKQQMSLVVNISANLLHQNLHIRVIIKNTATQRYTVPQYLKSSATVARQ